MKLTKKSVLKMWSLLIIGTMITTMLPMNALANSNYEEFTLPTEKTRSFEPRVYRNFAEQMANRYTDTDNKRTEIRERHNLTNLIKPTDKVLTTVNTFEYTFRPRRSISDKVYEYERKLHLKNDNEMLSNEMKSLDILQNANRLFTEDVYGKVYKRPRSNRVTKVEANFETLTYYNISKANRELATNLIYLQEKDVDRWNLLSNEIIDETNLFIATVVKTENNQPLNEKESIYYEKLYANNGYTEMQAMYDDANLMEDYLVDNISVISRNNANDLIEVNFANETYKRIVSEYVLATQNQLDSIDKQPIENNDDNIVIPSPPIQSGELL